MGEVYIWTIIPLLLSSFCLPVTASGTGTGLLVVGGSGPSEWNSNGENWETSKIVELWAPGSDGVHCRLPDLPESMSYLSLDSMLVGDGGGHWETIACSKRTCHKFSQGEWEFHRRTLQSRSRHTSAVFYTDSINGNILLAGGGYETDAQNSTEIVPDDHDQDLDITEGFSLKHERAGHCSIQVDHDGFILTGGEYGNSNEVTEYSFRGEDGNPKDLAPLKIGRWDHACGSYGDNVHGSRMLIVTGGRSATVPQLMLSSTEVFDYTNPGTWKEAGLLPAARSGLKGVSIGQDFFVTGGKSLSWWKDEILSWDPITESWTVAGQLLFERSNHGVAEVSLDVFATYCVSSRAAENSVIQVLVVLSFIDTVLNVAV